MFKFTLRTIYPSMRSIARHIPAARGGQLFETDGQKYIAKIHSEKKVDQLSSEMIGTISTSIPPEDNATISRDAQLNFVLQKLK